MICASGLSGERTMASEFWEKCSCFCQGISLQSREHSCRNSVRETAGVISDKFYLRVGGREIQDKTTIFSILSVIAMSLLREENGGNGLLNDGEEIVVSTSRAYLKKGGHLVTTTTFLEFDNNSRLATRLMEIADSNSV